MELQGSQELLCLIWFRIFFRALSQERMPICPGHASPRGNFEKGTFYLQDPPTTTHFGTLSLLTFILPQQQTTTNPWHLTLTPPKTCTHAIAYQWSISSGLTLLWKCFVLEIVPTSKPTRLGSHPLRIILLPHGLLVR